MSEEGCEDGLRSRCKALSTCPLCRAHQHCDWVEKQCVPAPNRTMTTALTNGAAGEASPSLGSENTLQTVQIDRDMASGTGATLLSHKPCQPTCAQRTSCTNCTQVMKLMVMILCSISLEVLIMFQFFCEPIILYSMLSVVPFRVRVCGASISSGVSRIIPIWSVSPTVSVENGPQNPRDAWMWSLVSLHCI